MFLQRHPSSETADNMSVKPVLWLQAPESVPEEFGSRENDESSLTTVGAAFPDPAAV